MRAIYIGDDGSVYKICRQGDGAVRIRGVDDDIPEDSLGDFVDGVFYVFDGVIFDPRAKSDDDLHDMGLTRAQVGDYYEWWQGKFREATPAEIHAVTCSPAPAPEGVGDA